ncbi:NnrS family protein [Thiofilum flexile]|uniref:NnrS family protein n=1 Tax=Thiofilum flexile TaxID=125627 RepID=UPI00037E5A3D|nr:NnrS family protein [Thiofilum flexile]
MPCTGLPLLWTAVADLGFACWLVWAASYPIIKAKQWAQAGIIAKISLLLLANLVFYLCLLGEWVQSAVLAIYWGLYIVLALILTMGRRVIPFFIERGVGVPFTARNGLWLDRASLIFFVAFALTDLIALGTGQQAFYYGVAALALIQVLLHTIRLQGWYHPLIWTKPLLWVLYLAYGWLIIGFVLKFMSIVGGISPWLAVHAFAYGGIGMMTLGMMARVSLGHTGRNVMNPPLLLPVLFVLLLLGTVVRVFAVWVWPSMHQDWILVAQILWITSFTGFIALYLPMWIKPNIPQIR